MRKDAFMTSSSSRRPDAGLLRRVAVSLGLVYDPDLASRPLLPRLLGRHSRYGISVAPHLDQDIDELRRRLLALEDRLG